MSDIPHRHASAPVHGAPSLPLPRPALAWLVAWGAGAGGLALGRAMGGDASAFDDKLLLLLRFMAAMKFVGVLAAAAATHWRLRHPIAPRLALAYIATLAPMAAAAGLIWSLGGIVLGALLFHVGLIAFLLLAWRDRLAR